ncbi:hypothetical protein [Hugenholtzia roseola]|uniref:hypothetical protein n=1 Tax=Hugenholtzia roseola TaxID=1002 RepID=UPI0003F9F244|nr:hypothetical protein [Hugenholtzia roseola]
MKKNKIVFFLATFFGMVALGFHISTFFVPQIGDISLPYLLFGLPIFPLWLLTILELRKRQQAEAAKSSTKTSSPFQLLRLILGNIPLWLKIAVFVFFFYPTLNFLRFATHSEQGTASLKNGEYVLEYRGNFIRKLTEEEYYYQNALKVQFLSGGVLPFYIVTIATFFPKKKE